MSDFGKWETMYFLYTPNMLTHKGIRKNYQQGTGKESHFFLIH